MSTLPCGASKKERIYALKARDLLAISGKDYYRDPKIQSLDLSTRPPRAEKNIGSVLWESLRIALFGTEEIL
jgi:hypothetical protein